jgi:hypothetical protein
MVVRGERDCAGAVMLVGGETGLTGEEFERKRAGLSRSVRNRKMRMGP